MRRSGSRSPRWLIPLLISGCVAPALAQPDVPERFRRLFVQYADNRSFVEKSLNLIGWTSQDMGHSFALIAGVARYPNMPATDRYLEPAAEDLRKLAHYLKTYEYFDEIVVLRDQDMNYENLVFFLQTYFPKRLKQFPKSRFLFAYSGHGMSEGTTGYLLKHTARDLGDKDNSISLKVVRVLFDEIVESGHHVLALINACYSGNFLRRSFGPRHYVPEHPGAHAITAGGSNELTWHDPDIGSGSLFFEKFLAALEGRADFYPKRDDGTAGDGMVTVDELTAYLRQEIQIFTDQNQNPQAGDISKHGSLGSFFFLDRRRQIDGKTVPQWKPDDGETFGGASRESRKTVIRAKQQERSQQYDSAAATYRAAAEQGNAEAMLRLGLIYSGGRGVATDHAAALGWFRRSAEAGNASAMYHLGILYARGQGVERDDAEALRWMRKGARGGDPWAMYNLGVMYEKGQGAARSYSQAMRWFKKAAEAGVAAAMTGVAYLHHHGHGVPPSLVEAERWYRKGAEAGDPAAMDNLAAMYAAGLGVNQDFAEALRWFKKAAEQGDAAAMAAIGMMYERGQGVEADLDQARRWYRAAADRGHDGARQRLAELDRPR